MANVGYVTSCYHGDMCIKGTKHGMVAVSSHHHHYNHRNMTCCYLDRPPPWAPAQPPACCTSPCSRA
ncbi:hypothetical protein SLEP1_g30045 [Rubroshorea leprosula]|uniref:Uncharacterized protein n=1 Tax=Rubroshorea leprosula TaxID=152421 RepID=A0AAV5JYU6_9ROSI|nr:hypothetical protein SLEP1_g30045 [Rubroshorea leprosula]